MKKEKILPLQEQFKRWFCDYGSHVVLHRAVPHILDGFKPSQRRVLHSVQELEDGRYNKAMSIIGNTAKYHPHGEASVADTLVAIAQKGYLIDTQGNWGNTLTGDNAAAPRYIEGRLTNFAKEVLFSPKVTSWVKSYDGRNDEPVTLPVKFPILLAQGTEGIAVSLACKILPHNFHELCDAAIAAARGEKFTLLPDFPSGGIMDATNYNDGESGGKIKVRARIKELSKNKLEITEVAYGTTTVSLKESILEAVEKGKIRIKHIDDMTSDRVSLILEVPPGGDTETTIQALYNHTDCEVSHNPIGVVIDESRPHFVGISKILKRSVENTRNIIKQELEIRLAELSARWMKLNLEKLFIETKTYQVLEKCHSEEEAITTITSTLTPHLKKKGLRRVVTPEDIKHLTGLPLRRISLYDSSAAEREIQNLEEEEKNVQYKLSHLTKTLIDHYKHLKKTYGAGRERRTEISQNGFVVCKTNSETLPKVKTYWNPTDGFIGTGLKKEAVLPFETNGLTDLATISKGGSLRFGRVKEKTFFNENLLWCEPTNEDETITNPIFNILYKNGEDGKTYAKRFQLGEGFVREKNYPICPPGSEILFLKAQLGKKADNLTIKLKDKSGAKKKEISLDFESLLVKNRLARGVAVTPYPVSSIEEK